MKLRHCRLALLAALMTAATAAAQTRLTGTIIGKVTDTAGLVVPGVTITVSGPALIRTEVVVTDERGEYRVINLPPGTYTVLAELEGFQTVRHEQVVVAVGMDLRLNLTLTPAQVEQTITVVGESPIVDVQQTKNTQTITKDALAAVPLARSIISAIQLAPGVVDRAVMGSARNDMAYLVDGANVNAPDQGYAEAQIDWDTIEEIEFITTGNPVENYGVIGGALNVVTKSGGNHLSGAAQYYFTNKDLAQVLVPAETRDTLGVGQAAAPEFDRDLSLTMGGPVVRDRIWFFTGYRYNGSETVGSFRPMTILGQAYENYNAPFRQDQAFGKITAQFSPKVRAFGSYTYAKGDRPNDFSIPYNRTQEATRHWQMEQRTVSANLSWLISAKTYLDARYGLWWFDYDGLAQPGTEKNPAMRDLYTSYTFGRLAQPDATRKRNHSASVKISRFVDSLAGSHEFKGGLETQHGYAALIVYSQNSMEWDIYNDDIYYYRGLFGLTGPHPTFGDGRIRFRTAAIEKGGSLSAGETTRYGFFVQDKWGVTDKLTLSLGVRYDTTSALVPGSTKANCDTLAQAIGAAVLSPVFGINPFGSFEFPEWDVPLPWSGFSPQAGFSYDLFGSGRTAVKGQWARYQERMPTWHFTGASPAGNQAFAFNWWDQNGNGQPDPPSIDRYERADTTSPLDLSSQTWKESIDPNMKTPYLDEYTIGVDQQLAAKLRFSVLYVHRSRKNLASNPLYDLSSGRYWASADSGYWVPFETIVPAVGNEFPAQPVTVYFRKANSPTTFYRLTNVAEATATYDALTLTVNRRMADGWQLGGSLVFSKSAGTYPIGTGSLYGAFQTPNYLVNRDGRHAYDRPVQVKLWGTVTLPYDVLSSFSYSFASGSPWGRTVSVIPPPAWAAANGTTTFAESVNLEPSGTRRTQSTSNLDLRVEKVFHLPYGHRIGFFVDAFNVLGFSYFTVQANPGGTWRPADVNSTEGVFSPAFTGLTGQSGTRTLKFSLRYTF